MIARQQSYALLHQAEGSREFTLVRAEVTTGQETSQHKFPVNVSKLVNHTWTDVTNS